MDKPISNVLELRVDSLVLDKHKEVHRFTFMDFMNFRHPNMGGNYGFYAIPLTEEWLLRFGFSNGNNEISNCDLWDKHYIGDFELFKFNDVFEYECKISVKYVHQLQNLYFALTGEEICLKP